jgi:hypothetical protein
LKILQDQVFRVASLPATRRGRRRRSPVRYRFENH